MCAWKALRLNLRHLTVIAFQIETAAERKTIGERPKERQYGKGTRTWSGADQRHFLACVAALVASRRAEIDALRRKIERQRQAIEARRRKLGINAPLELQPECSGSRYIAGLAPSTEQL